MKSYSVELSDVANAEAEAAYLNLSQRVSLPYATKWYAGLLAEIQTLSLMPGRFAVAREDERYPDFTVRRLLYGRGRTVYRILYYVIEPENEGEEGAVRILHVFHGAQDITASEHDARDEADT